MKTSFGIKFWRENGEFERGSGVNWGQNLNGLTAHEPLEIFLGCLKDF